MPNLFWACLVHQHQDFRMNKTVKTSLLWIKFAILSLKSALYKLSIMSNILRNFCYGFDQILIFHKPYSLWRNIKIRHQRSSHLHRAIHMLAFSILRNQSPCLLDQKTLGRSLGANQLSSPDSGLNRFKLACHWLSTVKGIVLYLGRFFVQVKIETWHQKLRKKNLWHSEYCIVNLFSCQY